ncbi:MAG TPA: hypothetical protein VF698_10030 [Thermoanaerobaculia bacterium]
MRRLPFLPTFFICLGIVFAAAVFVRLRAFSANATTSIASPDSSTVASSSTPQQHTADGTLEPFGEGALQPLPNATAPPTVMENTPTNRTRAARFDELLRRPIHPSAAQANNSGIVPAAAAANAHPQAAAAAPKPSLIAKVVTPIVNALTGRDPRPLPRAMNQKPEPSAGSRPAPAPVAETTHEPKQPADPNDPSSDTAPPQVLSIEFVPPQVRDGEETMLVVVATDDLSGIRNISGSIASPSGALQGFACQREGETNRWVARIPIPKDAAEGVWRVNYLSLMDHASNSVNLGAGGALPATATFRVVSNRPDSSGPTLKAVWLGRQAMKAGEKNQVFVTAEDDKSGVTLVSGVFQSPSGHARIGFGCRAGTDGNWTCDVTPPACLDCGEWKLEQIQMQDKANNMSTMRADNQLVGAVRLHISGEQCDAEPPQISGLQFDRVDISNAEATTITITAMASDDLCGVASISGQALGPAVAGQPRLYVSFTPSTDANTWIGRLVVPRLAAKGTWTLSWLQVLDKGHNLRTYSASDGVLQRASFNVQ